MPAGEILQLLLNLFSFLFLSADPAHQGRAQQADDGTDLSEIHQNINRNHGSRQPGEFNWKKESGIIRIFKFCSQSVLSGADYSFKLFLVSEDIWMGIQSKKKGYIDTNFCEGYNKILTPRLEGNIFTLN